MSAPATIADPSAAEESIYTRTFWIAYIGHLTVVTANAVTFRFAELVVFLGGTDQTAGNIVSDGLAGALLSRLFLGQAIDHFGLRRVWIATAIAFFVGALGLLLSNSVGWPIYVSRIFFSIGIAGAFTGSNVHIQNQVPFHRRTEAIGTLGTSGFLGLILGTTIGDFVFDGFEGGTRFAVLFGIATALTATYVFTVALLTRRDVHDPPHETLPAYRLVFKYQPLSTTLVALMMGMTFCITTVFLTRYATFYDLGGIGPFFFGYAASAFVFRIATRRWSRSMGRHRMILIGLAGYAVGQTTLIFVTNQWLFLVPALFTGFGHALLFPAVVSMITEAYPKPFRGNGTNMALGSIEAGTFLFAPLIGFLIDFFPGGGFTQTFALAAILSLGTGIIYVFTGAKVEDTDLSYYQLQALRENEPPQPEEEFAVEPDVAARPELCGASRSN